MAGDASMAGLLQVQVAFSPRAAVVRLVTLRMPAGSTVADAVRCSGLLAGDLAPDVGRAAGEGGGIDALHVAVWGRSCAHEQPLREGDRVELLRPLRIDPKDARRARQRGQGRAGGMPPANGR